MRRHHRACLISVGFAWAAAMLAPAPLARGSDLATLLQQDTRPTMSQIARALPTIPDDLPRLPANGQAYDFESWLNIMMEDGPRFLATIEKTFPNATWAFLGRDSQALADLTEAFYRSIGQKNRVVRIAGSSSTFAGASNSMITRFMQEYGLSIDTVNQSRPFILVDTVSRGGGRQGRRILDAFYRAYETVAGGRAQDLVRRVNMIGLTVSTFHGEEVPIGQAERYLREDEQNYAAYGAALNDDWEHSILHFRDSGRKFSESGYDHFTGAWHEKFGPMQLDSQGKVRANPGASTGLRYRQSIVWFQKKIHERVNAPEFLERAQLEASRLGFQFPVKASELPARSAPAETEEFARIGREAAALTREMGTWSQNHSVSLSDMVTQAAGRFPVRTKEMEEPRKNGQTNLALELQKAFEADVAGVPAVAREWKAVQYVNLIQGLRARGQIHGRELKYLISATLKHAHPNAKLLTALHGLFQKSTVFQRMMTEDDRWITGKEGFDNYARIKQIMDHQRKQAATTGRKETIK